MTYMKEIRQLESQLAAFDIASEVDVHKKIDILNSLAWMLSDTDLKRAYELSETANDLASSPGEGGSSNQIGIAYSLRTMGYLNQRFGNYDLGLAQLLDALVQRGVNTPTDLPIDNKKIIYGSEIQPMRYENARTQSSSDHTNR